MNTGRKKKEADAVQHAVVCLAMARQKGVPKPEGVYLTHRRCSVHNQPLFSAGYNLPSILKGWGHLRIAYVTGAG